MKFEEALNIAEGNLITENLILLITMVIKKIQIKTDIDQIKENIRIIIIMILIINIFMM